ncbi:MAG: hypothetical protein ACRDE2_18255 [Chitinophagaceae bacterium]
MAACNQTNSSGKKEKKESAAIPQKQNNIKQKPIPIDTSKPVAAFEANMEDQVNNNDFIVKVFPTSTDDRFRINIQYGANTASDEFNMLPSEYYKKIALVKGENNNECILGFIDNNGKFNKMKLITGSGTSIGIKTLKKYYLSTK